MSFSRKLQHYFVSIYSTLYIFLSLSLFLGWSSFSVFLRRWRWFQTNIVLAYRELTSTGTNYTVTILIDNGIQPCNKQSKQKWAICITWKITWTRTFVLNIIMCVTFIAIFVVKGIFFWIARFRKIYSFYKVKLH